MSCSLQRVFLSSLCRVELHLLPSVFNIGKAQTDRPVARFLINSGNEYLLGTSLPYFPRGGLQRQPHNIFASPEDWQKSSSWGGGSAGDNLLYPVQTLDGEVHQRLGGRQSELKNWIDKNVPAAEDVLEYVNEENVGSVQRIRDPSYNAHVKCTTGDAVWTPCFPTDPSLQQSFTQGILHTVSPYHDAQNRDQLLRRCYSNCLKLAGNISRNKHNMAIHVTTALLGTGVKCIEYEDSVRALARGVLQHQDDGDDDLVVELVVQPTRNVEHRIEDISRVFREEGLDIHTEKLIN